MARRKSGYRGNWGRMRGDIHEMGPPALELCVENHAKKRRVTEVEEDDEEKDLLPDE